MMFDSRPAFDPRQQLLEQRTVMISGPLDTTKASEVAALLMTLDVLELKTQVIPECTVQPQVSLAL